MANALNPKLLGKNLLKYRVLSGYKTAREFARANFLKESTYYQHESGTRTPTKKILQRYADILNITIDDLTTPQSANHNIHQAEINQINEPVCPYTKMAQSTFGVENNISEVSNYIGIGHINIVVDDMPKAIDLYKKLFKAIPVQS
jgi:transcriptional regulator with XRE-family HTH domain